MPMPRHFAGLFRSLLDQERWATKRILKMADFGEKSNLYEQSLHSSS